MITHPAFAPFRFLQIEKLVRQTLTPREWAGEHMRVPFCHSALIQTPLGPVFAQATGMALTKLYFAEQALDLPDCPGRQAHPLLESVKSWLAAYFDGARPGLEFLPLKPCGTLYQKNIWRVLLQIPYGQTCSYGELAKMAGPRSCAARACGTAVGRNPISLIIPCHRVIRKNGDIGGYAGGIERKKWLLAHESGKAQLVDGANFTCRPLQRPSDSCF